MLRALHNTPLWEDWEHGSLENLLFNDKSTDINSSWAASYLDEMQSVKFLGCSFPLDMSFRCDSLSTSHSLLVQQHLECCYLEIESILISWERAEHEWNQERVLLKKTIETNLLHYRTEVLKLNESIEALKHQLNTLESQDQHHSIHTYAYQIVNKKMTSSSKSSNKQSRSFSQQQHTNASVMNRKQIEMFNCSDTPLRGQDVVQSATPSPSLLRTDHVEESSSTTSQCTRFSTKSPSPKGKKLSMAFHHLKGICKNCQPYLDQLYKNYKKLNLSFFHQRQRFQDIQQRQNELLRCLKDEGFSYCETVGKVYPSWKKKKSDTIVQLQQLVKCTEEKYQSESRLYKVLIRRCNAAVLVALRGLGNRKRRPNTLPKKKWAPTPTVALMTSSARSTVSIPRKISANSDSFDLSRELQLSCSDSNEVSRRSDEQKKTKPFNTNVLNVCKDDAFEHSRTHLPLLTDFDKSHFYKKSWTRSNSLSKSLPLVASHKTSNFKSHPVNLFDQRVCLSKSLNSLPTTANRTSLPYNPLPSFSKSLNYQSSLSQPIKKTTTHLPLIRLNSLNSANSGGKTQQRLPQQSTLQVSVKDSFSHHSKGFSDTLSLGTKANRATALKRQKSSNLLHDSHGAGEKMLTSGQTSNNRFNDSLTEIKLSRVSSPSNYINHSQRNLNVLSSSQSLNKEKPRTQRSGNYPPSRSALRYTSSISCVPTDLSNVCVPSKTLEDSKSLRNSYRTESSSKHDFPPMMQTFQRQEVFPPHGRLGANPSELTFSREYTLPTLDVKDVEDHRFLDYLKPSSLPPRTLENSTAQVFPAFLMSKKPMAQKKDVSIQPETSLKRNLLSSLSVEQMKKKNLPRPLRGWMDYALESLNLPVGVHSSPQRLSSSLSEALLNRSRRL